MHLTWNACSVPVKWMTMLLQAEARLPVHSFRFQSALLKWDGLGQVCSKWKLQTASCHGDDRRSWTMNYNASSARCHIKVTSRWRSELDTWRRFTNEPQVARQIAAGKIRCAGTIVGPRKPSRSCSWWHECYTPAVSLFSSTDSSASWYGFMIMKRRNEKHKTRRRKRRSSCLLAPYFWAAHTHYGGMTTKPAVNVGENFWIWDEE